MSTRPFTVVTGATTGIGLETARALARSGHHVLLHGRTLEKAATAVEALLRENPAAALTPVAADLADRAAVRALAQSIHHHAPALRALVNNAGVWNSHQVLTEEGIEQTFAVNHLAYFQLSSLLLPLLRKDPESRIICVASDSHKQVKGMDFDNLNLDGRYHGLRSYAQSKLANVLFVYEYERRRCPGDPAIAAVQPGLVQTDIGLKGNTWLHRLAWKVRRQMSGHKTPAEGARTSIHLAERDGIGMDGPSGLYWDNCAPKRSYGASYDEAAARQLWQLSETLLGHPFFPPPDRNAVQ